MSSHNSNDDASMCSFRFTDGRRCRRPRHSQEFQLCLGHERAFLQLRSRLATTFAPNTSKSLTRQATLSSFEISTYEKPGEGVQLAPSDLASIDPLAPHRLNSSNASQRPDSLCAFAFRDGRQCRMLRHSKKSPYCFHHERKLRHLREADKTASEICGPLTGDFVPATALTHSLTRVLRAVAEGRIDPKSATALARVASTLLKSIDASSGEFRSSYLESYWRQLVRLHYNDLPDYIPPAPRQPRRRISSNSTTNSGHSDSDSDDNSSDS